MKGRSLREFIRSMDNPIWWRTDDVFKRSLVDKLRSEKPPNAATVQLAAAILEMYFFPTRTDPSVYRQKEADYLIRGNKYLTAFYKAAGVPNPAQKAAEVLAASCDLTVEAVDQRIKRQRRAQPKK
jgi:hypothetical protein